MAIAKQFENLTCPPQAAGISAPMMTWTLGVLGAMMVTEKTDLGLCSIRRRPPLPWGTTGVVATGTPSTCTMSCHFNSPQQTLSECPPMHKISSSCRSGGPTWTIATGMAQDWLSSSVRVITQCFRESFHLLDNGCNLLCMHASMGGSACSQRQ